MTPKEFKAELQKLAREIGPKAEVSARIDEDVRGDAIYCSIYPRGLIYDTKKGGGHLGGIGADDFPGALVALRARWAEHYTEYSAQTIRTMALAIIRITAELGSCSDAALRQDFAPEDISRYGADACAEADSMASNGPFSIVAAAKANAA